MIFTLMGFLICLVALVFMTLFGVGWLFHGGLDCGPIDKYKGWTFYCCIVAMGWYCLIKYSPVTIAVTGG